MFVPGDKVICIDSSNNDDILSNKVCTVVEEKQSRYISDMLLVCLEEVPGEFFWSGRFILQRRTLQRKLPDWF